MTDTDTEAPFDFSTLEVNESDTPTNPPEENENVPKSDSLSCQVCGTPITYGGRGPKPKYCADHKKRSSGSTSRSKKKQGTDYREGISGILQLPAAVLGVAGANANKPELLADSAVVSHYTPGIAESLNELAQQRPEVAAVLDRVLQVGPYGLLLASVMPMVLQLLANHSVVPAGLMGTVTKESVLGLPEPDSKGDLWLLSFRKL